MLPSTVEQIAREANLNRRYVKEWLGTMVTGKIIDYDSSNSTFNLQKEKATDIHYRNTGQHRGNNFPCTMCGGACVY
ncbi:MAG: hypothetical protein L0H53_15915 [Candidatus Nitrosocosmicus sp.]|nr:hypothetical protein [Candidatus Nitrosocosmicus sp.]MDN5866608.1 hypothetical protein [Candidatus Nitrosocosmicus sp.]